jgi:mono/diheme cytochrome c family protein
VQAKARISCPPDGERPGSLELRTDLTPDILAFFVRNGSGPMPGFRKTEVSDADVAAIAAYLKSSAAATPAK